jgi:outer membrane receptor protein involved in Fe transport
LKLALTKAGLSGTIAAFDQTRDNVATPDPNNVFYSIQTGQQRARGAEAELTWEPIHAFSLLANYAYTEAEVTKDNFIPVGNGLARVPRNSGRIAARYRVATGAAKGLSFGAGVTGFSSRQDTVSTPECCARRAGCLRLRTPIHNRGFGSESGRSSHLRSLRVLRVRSCDAKPTHLCLRDFEDPSEQGVTICPTSTAARHR